MPQVFAFEWCSCIYESGYSVVSLHASKRGAVKAMLAEANMRWQQERDMYLQFGGRGTTPLAYQAWRVRRVPVQA